MESRLDRNQGHVRTSIIYSNPKLELEMLAIRSQIAISLLKQIHTLDNLAQISYKIEI